MRSILGDSRIQRFKGFYSRKYTQLRQFSSTWSIFFSAMHIAFIGVPNNLFSNLQDSFLGMFILSLGDFEDIYATFDETRYPVLTKVSVFLYKSFEPIEPCIKWPTVCRRLFQCISLNKIILFWFKYHRILFITTQSAPQHWLDSCVELNWRRCIIRMRHKIQVPPT